MLAQARPQTPELQCSLSEVVEPPFSPANSQVFRNPETDEMKIITSGAPAIVARYGYLVNFRAGGGVIVTTPALRWVWSDGAETGLTAGAPFVCWHAGDSQRNHDDCIHCQLLAELAEPEW